MAELLAGGEGGVAICPHELRLSGDLFPGHASHVGKPEQPHGQADEGDPDELTFGEELDGRYVSVQGRLQQEYVRPALMVADHQIPPVPVEMLGALPLHVHLAQPEEAEAGSIRSDPTVDDPAVELAAEPPFERRRAHRTHGCDQEQRDAQRDGVQRHQRRCQYAFQERHETLLS